MQILFTSDYLDPDNIGGSGRVIVELARRLAEWGHGVGVIAGGATEVVRDVGFDDSGQLISGDHSSAAETTSRLTLRSFPYATQGTRGWRFFFHARSQMRRAIAQWVGEPDLIVHNQPLSAYCMRSSIERRWNVPQIYLFHSPWPLEILADRYGEESLARLSEHPAKTRWGVKLRHSIEARALRGSHAWITLSQTMRGQLETLHEIRDGVHVVPGGVDLERFTPLTSDLRREVRQRYGVADHERLWVCVRRLVPRTGVDLLLEAFSRVACSQPRVQLLIAGKGPEKETLQKRCRELGLGPRVRFLGYVADAELPNLYGAADAAIVPTRALEGFGLSTLEALACNTPVMATPVGGTVEILQRLHPELLSRATDPEALAQTMQQWHTEDAALTELRELCRPYVEAHYRWSILAQGLLDIAEQLAPSATITT